MDFDRLFPMPFTRWIWSFASLFCLCVLLALSSCLVYKAAQFQGKANAFFPSSSSSSPGEVPGSSHRPVRLVRLDERGYNTFVRFIVRVFYSVKIRWFRMVLKVAFSPRFFVSAPLART